MRLVRLDWPLLVGLLALIALGLVVSYSAAGQSELVLRNQLIRVAVGLGVLLVVSQTTPPLLLRWAPALYMGTVGLLVVVEVLGVVGQGAQRWLDLGVVRFQPSELAKITVPMMLAWYLSDKALPVDLRSTLVALALLVVPVALIMVQPDLGTSLLVAGAALAVVFLSGVPWRWLLVSAGGVLAAAPLAWSLMQDYQRRRVMTLLDPERMPGQTAPVLNWPYKEGLRIDEAMHPLTILAVGLYGEVIPNQNGAPVRLVVPWKYGFKSIKSIVRIKFQKSMPPTSWNEAAAREYGFYSNVNPAVRHPRWSQASERRIGEIFKRKTLMFNGYEEEVAGLYEGMDLRKWF